MATDLKREDIICMFDVDGTLTAPRQVGKSNLPPFFTLPNH